MQDAYKKHNQMSLRDNKPLLSTYILQYTDTAKAASMRTGNPSGGELHSSYLGKMVSSRFFAIWFPLVTSEKHSSANFIHVTQLLFSKRDLTYLQRD